MSDFNHDCFNDAGRPIYIGPVRDTETGEEFPYCGICEEPLKNE